MPAPKVPEAFVKKLVDGINARDLHAIRSITQPGTLKCMTPETEDYFAWWLWKDGTTPYTITPGYKTRMEKPIDVSRAEAAMTAASFITQHWPVQPDAGMRISYHTAPLSIVERQFQIALDDGKAQLVIDCPTQLGLEKFHEKKVLVAAQKRKLSTIWKNASEVDRKALRDMAKQGKKMAGATFAEKKYRLNMTDSMALMDMIEYADTP